MTRRALVCSISQPTPGQVRHSQSICGLRWPMVPGDITNITAQLSEEAGRPVVIASLAWLGPEPVSPLTLRQRVGCAAIAVVLVASVALDVASLVW